MRFKFQFIFILGLLCIGILCCTVVKGNRAISGIALKADGTPFGVNAKVIAIDSEGKTASGKIDENGKFKVVLSNKDFFRSNTINGVEGNSFLSISEGSDLLYLMVAEEQTKINFNVITAAATQLIIDNNQTNLSAIFEAAETSLVAGKKGNGQITNQEILDALALVPFIKEDTFIGAATFVVGAMFGYDSLGNTAVKVDPFLTGSADSKEFILIKAASLVVNNILSAAISATQNPENSSFLLNNENFYEAVGKELADAEGTASPTAYSDFLTSIINSQEINSSLEGIALELNAFVLAAESQTGSFDVTIPEISVPAETLIISVDRDVDAVSYSVDGGLLGDEIIVLITLQSATEIKLVFEIPMIMGETNFVLGTKPIKVSDSYNYLVTKVKTTNSIVNGVVDLEVLLAEAKAELSKDYPLSAEALPTSARDYILKVTSTPISRAGISNVATFISTDELPVFSIMGVYLE